MCHVHGDYVIKQHAHMFWKVQSLASSLALT